jgi:hypothetical protein
MRQLISGMVAAVAVLAASPAMACGYSSCSPCATGYVSPCASAYVAPTYSYGYGHGCNTGCGGWATERLAEPTQQYYYVNQGPTYTGPGNWAPVPTYSEGGSYSNYGYGYGHRAYRPRVYGLGYGYHRPYRAAYRYGYAPRHYGMHHAAPYHYGHRVLRRYY